MILQECRFLLFHNLQMKTKYTARISKKNTWRQRKGIQSDLSYFLTQLGKLANEKGQKILFHTGNFYDTPTRWKTTR